MSSNYIVELNNIWKKYMIKHRSRASLREDIKKFINQKNKEIISEHEFWALKDINIQVKKGDSIGLYGPNGSGKTTIIKLIASVTYPTLGEAIVRDTVAPLISVSAGFHPDLTGYENIFVNGSILGLSISEIKKKIDEIVNCSGLESEFLDMPLKRYSTGMTTRLGFAIAVHSRAEIFLLDEVLAVGDHAFRQKCSEKIDSLMKEGKTFIIVSHQHERIVELTNKIYYLEKGSIVDKPDILDN